MPYSGNTKSCDQFHQSVRAESFHKKHQRLTQMTPAEAVFSLLLRTVSRKYIQHHSMVSKRKRYLSSPFDLHDLFRVSMFFFVISIVIHFLLHQFPHQFSARDAMARLVWPAACGHDDRSIAANERISKQVDLRNHIDKFAITINKN